MKSGCKVEFLKHRKCERIERAVTINAVIAWRLAAMTLLGRETPELPMELLFSETEIGVLKDFARQNRKKVPQNLGDGVVTMAMLAGYLNRKNDPPPGYKKIWEGYRGCESITKHQIYELMKTDIIVSEPSGIVKTISAALKMGSGPLRWLKEFEGGSSVAR